MFQYCSVTLECHNNRNLKPITGASTEVANQDQFVAVKRGFICEGRSHGLNPQEIVGANSVCRSYPWRWYLSCT
jgi:hypothetical protein